MNTLQSHREEFESGIVTESGFAAMDDAEGYGAASTVGAGSASVAMLWRAFEKGESLSLYSKDKSVCRPMTEEQLAVWCKANFPACYGEYLRRLKH
ncbi:hypothetical protein [Methylophaga thalassica]|nr:hypothetical protein [Methylophaga aminisulfidivorans]